MGLVCLMFVALLGTGGYLALPYLIERETVDLRAEVKEFSQKVEKLETFVSGEEQARKTSRLEPGADAEAIIREINAVSGRLGTLDSKLTRAISRIDEAIKDQNSATAAALNRQANALEKEKTELLRQLREVMYKATVAQIRGHLLKIKTDLLARNLGTADAEIEVTVTIIEKAKRDLTPQVQERLESYQSSLKKARNEITSDLPAAMKRIDLIWHESAK